MGVLHITLDHSADLGKPLAVSGLPSICIGGGFTPWAKDESTPVSWGESQTKLVTTTYTN